MKKTYKLEDLECANCAAKMEEKINRLTNVNFACVNFMTQKLIVDINEECFDSTLKQIQQIIKKFEPDCTILM